MGDLVLRKMRPLMSVAGFIAVRNIGLAALVAASLIGTAAARDNQATGLGDAATPEPPLQMLVSIDDQKISVFRGTELIETAPISSGRRGYSTPTGVFSILEKRRRHFSNLYDNAPMPYMQRLTWSGIALHQGRLPGYPASHGCIRLPKQFAKTLFGMTSRGMHVLVTRETTRPDIIEHDNLFQPPNYETSVASLSSAAIAADPAFRGSIEAAARDQDDASRAQGNPEFDKPLRIIVTPNRPINQVRLVQRLLNEMGFNAGPVDGIAGRKTKAAIELFEESADLQITGQVTSTLVARIRQKAGYNNAHNATLRVRRNFRDIYQAPVTLSTPDAPVGTHVFTALGFAEGDTSVDWMGVSAEGDRGGLPRNALDRLQISDKVRSDLSRMLTPGTSLIITDRGFKRNTGLGTDFVVVTR